MWWVVSATPRPLYPQGRSGHVRKISPPPGFDPGGGEIAVKMAPKKLENNFFLVSALGKLLVFLVNYAYYVSFFYYEKVR
jgi:hypothetical protein